MDIPSGPLQGRRTRLTLGAGSASSSRHLSLNANIPRFTHPSSQQSTIKFFKPLPKPRKEKQDPTTNPKAKAKPKAKAASKRISSITNPLLTFGSGSSRSLTKKALEKAEAERKKKEGSLEEVEEGCYDDNGFWQDSAVMEEWKLGTTNADDPKDMQEQPGGINDSTRLRGEHAEVYDVPMEDNDADIAQELVNLHNIPSSQPFEALFDPPRSALVARPPTPYEREPRGAGSLVADRGSHSTPTPRMGDTWGKRHEGAGRYLTSNLRGNAEADEFAINPSQPLEPEMPMPPSAQPERRKSVSAPTGRAPPSRLKHTSWSPSDGDEEGEDDGMVEEIIIRSPGNRVPRVEPTDFLGSQDELGSEGEMTRMSPTEMNSSNLQEPVARSSTRRSNSRQRVYSIHGSQSTPVPSIHTSRRHPSHIPNSRPDGPGDFPVSDSEPSTQTSADFDPAPSPVTKSRTLNTYSKSASRVSKVVKLPRREIVDPKNPARQPGFRDQFSPEPEWENQQRRQRHRVNADPNPRSKSKRRGSTSFWPASLTGPESVQSRPPGESEEDDEEEDVDEEGDRGDRHPLRDVRVNEQGRILARGRGRNGAWPDVDDLGLFGDGDGDEYRPRPEREGMRPVSERLHLVHVKEEEGMMDADEEPQQQRRRRKDDPDRVKAFTDPRHTHPVAKLKLTRSHSVQDRIDGYTSKLNSRHRHDRSAYIPGPNIHKLSKPSRRRKDITSCDDLPRSVLKPIERITIGEYRQQLKSRPASDGFVNPLLVKAGRLAARDELLIRQQQRRIRSTGASGRSRGFHAKQTPIMGDDGVVDEIVAPTQTQRDSNPDTDPDPINNQEPEHQGFAARHKRIKRSRAGGQAGHLGRLRFTTHAPDVDLNSRSETSGLNFTDRSPPRTRTTGQVSIVNDTYGNGDEEEEMVQPAPGIPELAQPKVGYINRFRGKGKRARVEEDAGDELQDDLDEEGEPGRRADDRRAKAQTGMIRKVKGFWAPPVEEEGGWLYGDPLDNDQNVDTEIQDQDEEIIDHPDDHHDHSGGDKNNSTGKNHKAPLFLTGADNLDSTISNTVSGPSYEPAITTNLSGAGLSGAQLCDDLLLRNSLLSIPTISGKSIREAKRDERAKRITRKHDHTQGGQRKGPSTAGEISAQTPTLVPNENAVEDPGNPPHEEGQGEEMGDEIVAHQPILSQIRGRNRLERIHGEDPDEDNGQGGYQARSSQIRRRQGFGLADPGHEHGETQSTQGGPVWESSTMDRTSLGKSLAIEQCSPA